MASGVQAAPRAAPRIRNAKRTISALTCGRELA
jgi:hypothetical protein